MDMRMKGKDFSLDDEIRAGEKQTKIEFVASRTQNQEEIIIQEEQKNELKMGLDDALKVLNEREKYIIDKRLLSEDQQTLEEIGNKFNISRERVRQIEKLAINKIKKILVKKGIKADF